MPPLLVVVLLLLNTSLNKKPHLSPENLVLGSAFSRLSTSFLVLKCIHFEHSNDVIFLEQGFKEVYVRMLLVLSRIRT